MAQIAGCNIPKKFDQHLLDHAAEMFDKWGKTTHMDEKEHLFETFGLSSKPGDSENLSREKEALRCIVTAMMKAKLNRDDAATIIRNFNKINDPDFNWAEK